MGNASWLFVLSMIAILFPLLVGSIATEFGISYTYPISEVSAFGFDFLNTTDGGLLSNVLNGTINVILFIFNIFIQLFGLLFIIFNNFIVVLALLPLGFSMVVSSIYVILITYIIIKMLPTT